MDRNAFFYRTIVARFPTAAVVLERSGVVLYANPAADVLFDARCAGATLSTFFSDPARCDAFVRSVAHSQAVSLSQSFEGDIVGGSGERLHLMLLAVHALDEPAFDGIVLSVVDITDFRRREQQLVADLSVDALTGLCNRRAFADRMNAFRRDGNASVLAMFDLDHFKRINDQYGHAVGDEILRAVASRLVEAMPAEATVARMGGEEFVIVVPHATIDEAKRLVGTLLDRIRRPIVVDDVSISITSSAGIAELSARPLDRTLSEADIALYAAKSRGRDQIAVFGADVREVAEDKRQLADTVSRLSSENRTLMAEARTDALTGLRNFRALAELESQVLGAPDGAWTQSSVLFIDIDHFSEFNKAYSDSGGDKALRQVGAALAQHVRTSDFAFRKGGEEFVLLLPDTDLASALAAAQRIRASLAALGIPHAGSTTSALLTVTIGVAWGGPHQSIGQLAVRAGDQAMRGKRNGQRDAVHHDLPDA